MILTIPMATVGGIISLRLMDLALSATGGQKMDLLTMIGFVILLGLVVNNAILLVYRARDGEREGMSRRDAVESAVRLRSQTNSDEYDDQYFRYAAVDADSRFRYGTLPGYGRCDCWRDAGQRPVYTHPVTQSSARQGRRISGATVSRYDQT